jgi:hypothetical protein
MTDSAIERRHVLRNAGIIAGGAAAMAGLGAVPASADDGDDDHDHHHHGQGRRLLGSWLVTRTEGDSSVVTVGSFAVGGVAIVHDINPALPPLTGSWRMRGHDSWQATLWTGFASAGGPGTAGGTARLRIFGRVTRRRIAGTYDVRFFDPGGTEVSRSGGTFEGRPIEA